MGIPESSYPLLSRTLVQGSERWPRTRSINLMTPLNITASFPLFPLWMILGSLKFTTIVLNSRDSSKHVAGAAFPRKPIPPLKERDGVASNVKKFLTLRSFMQRRDSLPFLSLSIASNLAKRILSSSLPSPALGGLGC